MKIIRYCASNDITVEFQDEHRIKINSTYGNFNRGSIKNPYDKSLFGVGYYGVGDYVARQNYIPEPPYLSWRHLLERCYDESQKHKHPAYYGIATVCEEWLNYQNYAKWYKENYYDVGDGKRMHIDKDILVKDNKIYSPETCIFVPQRINMLFMTKIKNSDFDLPNSIYRCIKGYKASYNGEPLGVFKSIKDAINAHDSEMRIHIKEIVKGYGNLLPPRVHNALLNW